jgi:large exoprotein involved in heme utilization and adhesion
VAASRVTLDNGATVTAKSSGAGDAGTITINAGKEFLSANGSLTTESLQASGGNITLLATDMVHLKNSQISASVQGGPNTTGGNILIDPQFVILQNSQIIAQAFQGQGGNISIVANTFLSDASSLVSASSQFGLSGTVNISSPTQALSGALVPLKQNYLSGAMLLNQRCAARTAEGQVSTFIVTEHEGLPQEPGGLLSSLSIEHDGGVSFESVEQVLMASVRPSFFTPMSYEQRIWTDESCRR